MIVPECTHLATGDWVYQAGIDAIPVDVDPDAFLGVPDAGLDGGLQKTFDWLQCSK